MVSFIGWLIASILALGGSQAVPVPQVAPIQVPVTSTEQVVETVVESTQIPRAAPVRTPSTGIVPVVDTPVAEPQVPTPVYAPTKMNCNPNYSGCLKSNAGDYDCAGGTGNGPNYTGTVRVLGYDEYGLDRDNDGWGCD